MPYKDPEKAKQHAKEYYHANKDKRKNLDGTWKYDKNYQDRKNALARNRYEENKEYFSNYRKIKRKEKQIIDICPLCNLKKHLVTDHNHETGKFRGYICALCNTALGYVKDNKQTLQNLIDYLEDFNNDLKRVDQI